MSQKKLEARNASHRHRGERPGRARVQGVCTVPDCGRSVYARELCQTHHRQSLTTGQLKAIRPYRRRSSHTETVKFSGLRLTPGCAEVISRFAETHALSPSAVIIDILEEWFVRGARPPAGDGHRLRRPRLGP